ncbi:formylglycine-generating enzyme required for sulfatase activity [Paenibacillus endophyticus]|uniref:Formylglycine-generating enzyme required for sulfatase activity n=1 Tax=Paenibacillus endophyticus TaxID=1294268 RepID=A0A7W5G8K8_9BACL|nr:formylglycine-generating enzyme required for sulfatase activity [Paenibacillus endophyticus]
MDHLKTCCAANRQLVDVERIETVELLTPKGLSAAVAGSGLNLDMVVIPAGSFDMGTTANEGFPSDGEGPVRSVELDSFRMSTCAVTNAQFQAFVKATGYRTEAEQFG